MVAAAGTTAVTGGGSSPLNPEGGVSWSAFGGYGWAQNWRRGQDVDIVSTGLRWSNIGGLRGRGAGRGHHGFALELVPWSSFQQEPDAVGGGLSALYEYHFLPRGRWLPVVRTGAGFLLSDRDIPPGEVRDNFSLFAGAGLRMGVSRRGALEVEYRLHHVSNAGTGVENPGINALTLLVGYAFYPR